MKAKLAWTVAVLVMLGVFSWAGRTAVVTAQDSSSPKPGKSDELHQAQINYAKALLKVAEADLAKADEANKKVAGTIPPSVVFGLRNDVDMAKARVKGMLGLAKDEKDNDYIPAAKDAISYAEEQLKRAQEANARVPGAVSKPELERRQAEVEVARARLEVAKLLNTAAPMEVAEWELLQLQGDVHELQFRVRLLQERN
jgi:multidrug resistance efflux pump